MTRLLPVLVGLAAVVAAVIKAKNGSITHDEAVTYALYVDGAWSRMFENYTAGNHVLFTILARFTTALFGASELTFRLPSLLAAVGIADVLRRLLVPVAGAPLAALGMAAILWNPLVLDYLAMARGYALSLLFYLAALAAVARCLERGTSRRDLGIVGVALGLSIAANLTGLLPAAALGVVFLCGLAASPARRASIAPAIAALAIPTAAATCLHLAAMEWEASAAALRPHFWYGTSSLPAMMASFDQRLLFHQAPLALVPIDEVVRTDWLSTVVSAVVSPATWAAVVLVAVVASARRSTRRLLIVAGTTVGISLALMILSHALAGVHFLRGRTGLSIVVTMLIGVVTAAAASRSSPRIVTRAGGGLLVAVLFAIVARGVAQFAPDRFGEGYVEAHARRNFEALETLRPAAARPPVRVLAHLHVFGPGLDFYRLTRAATWMAPVDRVAEPGVRYDAVVADQAFARSDVVRHHYREVMSDPETGVVVLAAR